MNLSFDVGKYCLALNTRRGALHCHYFLFVMIRVQKPHGLSPHLSQCFSSRGGNEHLMWCEVAAWCILSIFLSLDLGVLSLIATGDFVFYHQKGSTNTVHRVKQVYFTFRSLFLSTDTWNIQIITTYPQNAIALERSKCSELNRYLNSCCLNCIFGCNYRLNGLDFKYCSFCNCTLILLQLF